MAQKFDMSELKKPKKQGLLKSDGEDGKNSAKPPATPAKKKGKKKTGRPMKKKAEKLTEKITVNLAEKEYEKLVILAAEKDDMSLSKLVRILLKKSDYI